MNQIARKSKSSVLEQKVNNYEEAMKSKFIEVMQLPDTTYADCLDYIESEIAQSKKMAKSTIAFSVSATMVSISSIRLFLRCLDLLFLRKVAVHQVRKVFKL